MTKGKLIVFEGISGTGKETQAKLLAEYLKKQDVTACVVYHPSPELKAILSEWRKSRNIDHMSEAYFLLADRYNRVQNVIKPALARGDWVISLRSWVSALVYQAKTKSDREYLTKEFGRFEPKPDFLFFFDITPKEAINRIMKRHRETGERLGKFETKNLLAQKRGAYQKILKSLPHIRINVAQSINNIHSRIISPIQTLRM